jgi:hypothetical protein
MKVRYGFLSLCFLSPMALADDYTLTVSWSDETAYHAEESAEYRAKYRVAGGAETVIDGLPTPAASALVVADPGQTVEAAAQNCSIMGASVLCSPWSGWVVATAQYGQTQPADPSGINIQLIRMP